MSPDVRIEVLETRRLVLRPYVPNDAERITELLQDWEIYRWTGSIPYPYAIEDARAFLAIRAKADETGESFGWAVTLRDGGQLVGSIGLHALDISVERAELGYWIGEGYRQQGYTTEAARRVISWCFETAGFYRVQALYLAGNEGSAKVLRNIGMQGEGLMRGYGRKDEEYRDVHMIAVLRDDSTWMSTADQMTGGR